MTFDRFTRFDSWNLAIDVVQVATWIWVLASLPSASWATWAAAAAAAGTVVGRRRWPLLTTAAATALFLVAPTSTSLGVAVCVQACMFCVATTRSGRTTSAAGVVVAAALYLGVGVPHSIGELWSPVRLGFLAWTLGVAGVGAAVRSQRLYVQALYDRAERTAQSRDAEIGRRLAEERVRVARDLHDSVAHSIAVVSLHAGSAQATLRTNPAASERALADIRVTARTVLEELQQILSILRRDDADTDYFPGWNGLCALVESFVSLGLPVDATIDRGIDDVDSPVGVAVYRLLQESLTNAYKHGAGPTTAVVRVREDELRVTVRNEVVPVVGGSDRRAGRVVEPPPGGFGLIGMRERVSSAGGRLVIERTPGSFEVVAVFPAVPVHSGVTHK